MPHTHESKLNRMALRNRRGVWTTWGGPGSWQIWAVHEGDDDNRPVLIAIVIFLILLLLMLLLVSAAKTDGAFINN